MLPFTGVVRMLLLPFLRRQPLKLLLYQRPVICRYPTLSYGTTRRTIVTASESSSTSYKDPYNAGTDQLRRIVVEAQFILEKYNQARAVDSIRQLQKMGYRNITGVIDTVCRLLIEEDRLKDAVDLIKEIIHARILERGEIQQQTYHKLLKGFVELRKMTGDTDIAAQFTHFVNFMEENDYELDAFGYFNVMRMASLVGNAELALDCFHELQDMENYQVSVSEYGVLLLAHLNQAKRTNNYDGIAAVITWCNEELDEGYTMSVVDILITELIENNQLDQAVTIVKDLIGRSGVQIQNHTFTRLLKGFVDFRVISDDSNIAKSFSDFVHYMVGHGYNIDVFDQFQILRMAALEGSCELAKGCFDGLKSSDQFSDPTSLYWLLVQAHISAVEKNYISNCDSVFTCFEEMLNDRSADISTDPVKLFKVLQLSSWHGRCNLAEACVKGLQDNADCEVGSSEMGLLLQSYLSAAQIANNYDNHANIIQCIDVMVSKGLEITTSTMKASIEHLVRNNAPDDAREVIRKLHKDSDYLDYLEDLLQIERHLICTDEEAASKIARKSRYIVDCENFIASHRYLGRAVARFGTGLEEKNRIMEKFDQECAIERLSILHRSGYRKVGHVLNDVVGDLIKTKQFDDALNLTKRVIEQGALRILNVTYLRLLKGFADHIKVNKGSESAESFYKFIDLMNNKGYIADHWVQVEKLGIAAILGDGKLAQECFDALKASSGFKIFDRHYFLLLGALITKSKKNKSIANMEKVLGHFNVICNYDNGIVFKDHDLIEVLKVATALGDSKTAQLAFDKAELDMMCGIHHGLLLRSYVNQSQRTGKYENGKVVLQIFNEALDKDLEIIPLTIKMFIEHSIRSGLLQDALAAIQKLTKDNDKYVDYLYLLERIEQCLSSGDVKKAKTLAKESYFFQDCNRFINPVLRMTR